MITVKGVSLSYHEQTLRMHHETLVPLLTDDMRTVVMDAADIVARGEQDYEPPPQLQRP